MSIKITENSIAMWYVYLKEADWLCHIAHTDDGILLQYRFRYYIDDKAHDSKDEKRWFEALLKSASEAEAIASCQIVAKKLAEISNTEIVEMIKGSKTVEEFTEELTNQPFASKREMSAEEAKRKGLVPSEH